MKLMDPSEFNAHWVDDLSNEDYHANKEFVSSTPLKHLINESPQYFHEHFFNPKPKAASDAMVLSSLVHHAVLEGEDFIRRYVVMPKFDGHANSNVHKQAKAEWKEAHKHKIIVTEEEIQTLEGTYESIFNHPDAALILRGSSFERSGFYIDLSTGIPCRIRYDSYDRDSRILSDIKAVRSCKSGQFQYAIRDYRWDLSMAMYGDGIRAIDGRGPDDFVFIAVEKTAPYSCAVYPIGRRSLSIGAFDYRKALETLKTCITDNVWPPYQSEMQEIDLPEHFMTKYGI